MPAIVRETVDIPAVQYTGEIVSSEITHSEYEGKMVEYVNWTVQTAERVKGWNGQFKLSCPNSISKNTTYGRLLNRLGIPLPAVGESFDEADLVGMNVRFDTVKNGAFTNPRIDSVFRA